MTGATRTIGTGPGAWFGYIGSTLAGLPGTYRTALRANRRRTIAVTVLVVVALAYPYVNHVFLAPFSRNVFPLPVPDDTVATFMTIFAIMAIGLNIVAGFAGLLDLGYVAFYAIGAYVAAFLASPHWAALGLNIVFLGNVAPDSAGRPPAVLAARPDRGHRGGHLRRAARRAHPAPARRLPGDRDPGLRRDRAARLQEPVAGLLLAQPRADQHQPEQRQPDRRRAGHQPGRSALPAVLQHQVRRPGRLPAGLPRDLPAPDGRSWSRATWSIPGSAGPGWPSARTRRPPR